MDTIESQPCHLLRLPAELRLQIYDHVFQFKTVHLWIDWNVYRWRSYTPTAPASLLFTCKTINQEAASAFYDKTTIHFSICDEFERPLSRYRRFSTLKELNASAFNRVSKLRLSLHTLTYPIFVQLLDHVNSWLQRLEFCANAKAIEIHFEFWSTISDEDLYWIYDMLCRIEYSQDFEIGTRALGKWTTLYEGNSSKACLEQLRDDVVAARKGSPLFVLNQAVAASVGPRDLIIRSKSPGRRPSADNEVMRCLTGMVHERAEAAWAVGL